VPEKNKPRKTHPPPRRGARIDETNGELTLVGDESAEQVSHARVLSERALHHRQWVQGKAVLGLMFLIAQILPLGSLAMIGVAAGWFAAPFALQVLAVTLTPSFTAWLLVVAWAFRREGRHRG
jgi:hypothetical protein